MRSNQRLKKLGNNGRERAAAGASLVALAVSFAMLLPAGAAAISGAEIVQRLSQQREANGIPGGLIERPEWSADCAKHNYYGAQTGELRHTEDPSSPFYSAEGNWAAENSVLASGSENRRCRMPCQSPNTEP